MLKELHEGIYKAIDRPDIPLLASDLEEPKERPAIKIFIKPEAYKLNGDVRINEFKILLIYYASNDRRYYNEHYEMQEMLEDVVLGSIELSNGLIVEPEEVEFGQDRDILTAEFEISFDTLIYSEEDDELMEELHMLMNELEVDVT